MNGNETAPVLKYSIIFSFETRENFEWMDHFVRHQAYFGYAAGILYVCSIFLLQRWMRDRSPLPLKYVAILWNQILLTCNTVATIRMLPHFLDVLKHLGLYGSVCTVWRGWEDDHVYAFWLLLFAFFKVIELGDTFFIVLQKRFLETYYWTHHLGSLVISWYFYPFGMPVLLWLSIMINASHVPVYFYAMLKAMGLKLPRAFSIGLLVSEVVHMMWGTILSIYMLYVIVKGDFCSISTKNVLVSVFIYSFCFLQSSFLLYKRLTRKSGQIWSEDKLPTLPTIGTSYQK